MTDGLVSLAAMQQPSSFERNQPFIPQSQEPVSIPVPQFPTTPTKTFSTIRVASAVQQGMEFKKPLDISNLMSPPEPTPFDTFNQASMAPTLRPVVAPEPRLVPNPPLSPPISPFTKPSTSIGPAPPLSITVKDPILYPTADIASSPPEPLFVPVDIDAHRRIVEDHILSRSPSFFREATPPKPEDYELALFFKSNVLKMFKENPRGWLRKERELLRRDRKSAMEARAPTRLPPIFPATRPAPLKPQTVRNNANRVQKPAKSPTKIKVHVQNGSVSNQNRPIRSTPAPSRNTIRVSSTPEPRVRTVAPNREDKDFNGLPNLCPPLSSLPDKSNSLKVDWKGNALDLSKDPFVHLLHPDEVNLAAGLRLDCATYLTSKRRIFIRRLECAKIGKEFRKTDAQQACKIDVNKASKLWTAYDKVGWLNIDWMRPFM